MLSLPQTPCEITVRGRVRLELFDGEGVLKDSRDVENLITTVGRNRIPDQLLATPAAVKPTHMAIGTGAVAAALGDTALGAENARSALTSKTLATNVLTMVGDYAAGTGTGTITEAGVLNAASVGDLYSRAVFTGIVKAAADTLKVTYTYSFT